MSPSEPSVRAGQKTGMSFYTEQTTLSRGGAGTRDTSIHFVRPVIYRFLVVDLLAQPPDERARRPHLPRLLLLREHGVEDGREPVLELAVVVVRHDEVPDAVHATPAQVCAVHVEVCEVRFPEALDEVLLDAPGSGHDRVDVLVLDEVENDFTQPGRNKVRSVAQEDVALGLRAHLRREILLRLVFGDRLVRQPPFALDAVQDAVGGTVQAAQRTILFTMSMAFPRLFAWNPIRW